MNAQQKDRWVGLWAFDFFFLCTCKQHRRLWAMLDWYCDWKYKKEKKKSASWAFLEAKTSHRWHNSLAVNSVLDKVTRNTDSSWQHRQPGNLSHTRSLPLSHTYTHTRANNNRIKIQKRALFTVCLCGRFKDNNFTQDRSNECVYRHPGQPIGDNHLPAHYERSL